MFSPFFVSPFFCFNPLIFAHTVDIYRSMNNKTALKRWRGHGGGYLCGLILAAVVISCNADPKNADTNTEQYEIPDHHKTGAPPPDSSAANGYSWDGSWAPTSSDFPVAGMMDETHDDLPPGKWGWDGSCDCPGDERLDIYENEFVEKGLDFEPLMDRDGHIFGWRLIDTDGGGISLNHRLDNFEGSPGPDIIDLNPGGHLQTTGGINLGDGPDMLRYSTGWSTDLRTGADTRGALFDNDLVILGSESVLAMNEYDIYGTTIHTGPGSDLVFVRNFGPAAIDLGNGLSGRTDTMDEADGDDWVILQGNMRDFRIFGGYGNDVAVWYVDEVLDDRWLGPSFYGGGGWGDALWSDSGTDRLVLPVDPTTEIVHARGDHDNNPGSMLIFVYDEYGESIDGPTETDLYARYYGTAPVGPNGEHTLTLSYRSADGTVFTHDFYATGVEELQLGIGDSAVVYELDSVNGTAARSSAAPVTEIPDRSVFNELMDTFAR